MIQTLLTKLFCQTDFFGLQFSVFKCRKLFVEHTYQTKPKHMYLRVYFAK